VFARVVAPGHVTAGAVFTTADEGRSDDQHDDGGSNDRRHLHPTWYPVRFGFGAPRRLSHIHLLPIARASR
jgi:hypothetical protein